MKAAFELLAGGRAQALAANRDTVGVWMAKELPMPAGQESTKGLVGVFPQTDVVQYQPGAVVSRTLVKRPGGTVTAFAFDAGEGLSEHTAPFDALVLMVEGEAEVSISGTRYRVKAGELLRLPALQPHALKASTRFKMILVMIKA